MSDGCECKRCGALYKTDLYVPDADWERIRGGCNLLCPSCIMSALESLDGFGAYRLTPVDQLAAKDAEIAELRKELSEARQDGSRYRWLRDNCDAGASCVLCMRREPEEWAAEIDAALAATPEHLR